jgi:hypothetical protein
MAKAWCGPLVIVLVDKGIEAGLLLEDQGSRGAKERRMWYADVNRIHMYYEEQGQGQR